MHSEVRMKQYANGEFQRTQTVTLDSWENLRFFEPPHSQKALDSFAEIYRKHLIPACPWLFGNLVLFSLPEDLEIPFSFCTKKHGTVADSLTATVSALQAGVKIVNGRPVFRNPQVESFYRQLESRNCIRIVKGKLPTTRFLPVGNRAGFLTETAQTNLKVNASFFIMDPFDCASIYDHIGTPFGLCVKDGMVLRPPLFGREALLVDRNGNIRVEPVDVRDLDICIGGKTYRHGVNAQVFSRPDSNRTPPRDGTKLVIVERKVMAVCNSRRVRIPASGFVLRVEDGENIAPGAEVSYGGMEGVRFGIQVGNSILVNGEKTRSFRSRFYNIRHFQRVPFPPSLYPMDFRKARAARIALGADADGKPVILWAEGAPKIGYVPGQDSCGASLSEMAELCHEAGMVNAVNLDGGGSAQILLQGRRELLISDRLGMDERERPVPLALVVE